MDQDQLEALSRKIGESCATEVFAQRGRGRKNAEVHLSKDELAAICAACAHLGVLKGIEVAQ